MAAPQMDPVMVRQVKESLAGSNRCAPGPLMADPIEPDAERIVEVLNDHEVAYVVIGGFAALLHGSPRTTQDLDITPSVDSVKPRPRGQRWRRG